MRPTKERIFTYAYIFKVAKTKSSYIPNSTDIAVVNLFNVYYITFKYTLLSFYEINLIHDERVVILNNGKFFTRFST